MEARGEVALGQTVRLTLVNILRPRRPVMERTVHLVGLMALELHDIDFPARRPAAVLLLGRKHPESRPESLPCRQLRRHLETPIQPVCAALGPDTGGRILLLHPGHVQFFFPGLDDQVAVLDTKVLRSVEVILQLVIAAAVAVLLDRPFGPVELLAFEIVAPDLPPFASGQGQG